MMPRCKGAIPSVHQIDMDRAKVQCRSIVIATRGHYCASLIMHHACVYYLLSGESISLLQRRVQRRCTVRETDYLTRQNALSPSTYLDRLRSQECTPPASNCVGNSIAAKLSRHYSREPSRGRVGALVNRDLTRVSRSILFQISDLALPF